LARSNLRAGSGYFGGAEACPVAPAGIIAPVIIGTAADRQHCKDEQSWTIPVFSN